MRLKNIAMCLFTVAGAFLSSCIREDYSECYNRYVVDLSYTGDGDGEIFPEKIGKVQMYIFEDESNCIYTSSLTQDEIRFQRTMLPALAPGDYKIVFLANAYATAVKGLGEQTDFSEIMFGAEDFWLGQETSGNDSLYFSCVDYVIEPFSAERREVRKTALFESSHYDILVEVKGVPPGSVTDAPFIVLEGVSPYADFNNVATDTAQARYVLEPSVNGSYVTARCNILRHTDHSNVFLKLLDHAGNALVSVNFAEFIEQNSGHIDCTDNEVTIPFSIEFKNVDVEVKLPTWWVIDINPGWN